MIGPVCTGCGMPGDAPHIPGCWNDAPDALTAGMDRACVACVHYERKPLSGQNIDQCSNRRVRWDFVHGQPTQGNALAAEARAPGGRCGEVGEHWEPKP